MSYWVEDAAAAIKAGDKATGKRLLEQGLKSDHNNAAAWLWMSAVAEDPAQKRKCIEEVLRIKPGHPKATAILAKMNNPSRIKTAPLRKPEESKTPTAPLRNPPPPPPVIFSPAPPPPSVGFADGPEEPLYELPEWLSRITPPVEPTVEPTVEPPAKKTPTETQDAPYKLPDWMLPTDPFPVSRSASLSPTEAFVTSPQEDDPNALPEWMSSFRSIAIPDSSSNAFTTDVKASSDTKASSTEETSYELPPWMSSFESSPTFDPDPKSDAFFAKPQEDADQLPDWMPHLEPAQSQHAIFPDDDKPTHEPPRSVPINDEDRVEIPAWMERMYNPSQKANQHVRPFDASSEDSFWKTPLAESSPAGWKTTEQEPFEQPEPPTQEYPAWDMPWHEATQAQEQTRQAQQQNIRQPARRGYAWYDLWTAVILNQNVESFKFVLSDPNLSLRRAINWVCVAAYAQVIALYVLGYALGVPSTQGTSGSMGLIAVILCSPLLSLILAPLFLAQVGIQQLGAKAVGGSGSYREFAFALAAYQSPMLLVSTLVTIISNILVGIPYIRQVASWIIMGMLFVMVLINIRLNFNAYRAVHGFAIWQVFVAMLIPGLIVGVLLGCAAVFLMPR